MKDIKVFSWNVNGLRAVLRKGALKEFVSVYTPDVLLLQETKITEAGVADLKVLDEEFSVYTRFFSYAKRPGYAGTSVWIRTDLAEGAKMIEDIDGDGLVDEYGDLLGEGRICGVELADFYVISVYVPNSKDDLSRLKIREKWDEYLTGVVLELQEKKPVVIAGDFNVAHEEIDLARPAANVGKHGFTDEERRGFNSLLSKTGLVDTFRSLYPDTVKYSWWSHWGNARANNVGWRIDYCLVSEVLAGRVSKAEIYPEVLGSDHCPVSINIKHEEEE